MVERIVSPRLDAEGGRQSILRGRRVMHLTTVDVSLRYLLLPQLTAVIDCGGEVIGVSAHPARMWPNWKKPASATSPCARRRAA